MEYAVLAVAVVGLIGWSIALFLGKELMKKFGFLAKFAASTSGHLVTWEFEGRKSGIKPGMRKIVLKCDKPFTALVGFELTVPLFGTGFDYYGFVGIDDTQHEVLKGDTYVVVISTFLGGNPVKFQFLTSVSEVNVSSTEEDQNMIAHVEYKPHWWQRLSFYA